MGSENTVNHIGIFGASGSGKSTYAKRVLEGRSRIVVFDYMEEYEQQGFRVCRSITALRDAMAVQWETGFKLAYQMPEAYAMQALHEVSRLLMVAQMPTKRGESQLGLTFVVEEMAESFPVSGFKPEFGAFSEICRMGRHYGIMTIGTSQRIQDVNGKFRDNCSEAVCFMQGGDLGYDRAVKVIGKAHADDLAALKPHEYLRKVGPKVEKGKNPPWNGNS